MDRKLDRITPEHLGNIATSRDVAEFKAAVRHIAAEQFDGDEAAAEEYLWGEGDYLARLPKTGGVASPGLMRQAGRGRR